MDLTKSADQIVLDKYTVVEINYKVDNGNMTKLRISAGNAENGNASLYRAKSLALEADGNMHTVTMELKSIQSEKGYLYNLGIYFARGAAAL